MVGENMSFEEFRFMLMLSSADIFSKLIFSKLSFWNNTRVSNSLDPDQNIGPDLGPNCLQRLTADDKRVN